MLIALKQGWVIFQPGHGFVNQLEDDYTTYPLDAHFYETLEAAQKTIDDDNEEKPIAATLSIAVHEEDQDSARPQT